MGGRGSSKQPVGNAGGLTQAENDAFYKTHRSTRFPGHLEYDQTVWNKMGIDRYDRNTIEAVLLSQWTQPQKAHGNYWDIRLLQWGGEQKFLDTQRARGRSESEIQSRLSASKKAIPHMERFLQAAPKMPQNTELFRGISFPNTEALTKFLNTHKIGAVIQLDSITSFSTSTSVAFNFGTAPGKRRVVMRLKRHKSAVSIAELSSYGTEREALLPKGAKIRLMDVRSRKEGQFTYYEFDAKEV